MNQHTEILKLLESEQASESNLVYTPQFIKSQMEQNYQGDFNVDSRKVHIVVGKNAQYLTNKEHNRK